MSSCFYADARCMFLAVSGTFDRNLKIAGNRDTNYLLFDLRVVYVYREREFRFILIGFEDSCFT